MKKQQLAILGSTGSIGLQALEIAREHPHEIEIFALTANTSWEKLAEQISEFKPKIAVIGEKSIADKLAVTAKEHQTILMSGPEELAKLVERPEIDTVLNALVGFAGFLPTVNALKAGKKVALANKESLVVGGAVIKTILKNGDGTLVPVDSEHSAMLQSIVGEDRSKIEKIIVTASGGPFRTWSYEDMKKITVDEALNHPNWSMGAKITVDSSTMMNKGLEIIETHWLFDLPLSQIDAVVHPESIVHSIVTYVDGSSKAQLGPPTMKVPIQYALTYPQRLDLTVPRLDWSEAFKMHFEPIDYRRFPCIKLAVDAIKHGGSAPAVLNAANEVAVDRFLGGEIRYLQISNVVEQCLDKMNGLNYKALSVEFLQEVDIKTREVAKNIYFKTKS